MTLKGFFQLGGFLASIFPAIWLVFDVAVSRHIIFLSTDNVLNTYPAIYFLLAGSCLHFFCMMFDGFRRRKVAWIVGMMLVVPFTSWLYYLLVYVTSSGQYPSIFPSSRQVLIREWQF